MIFGTIAGNLGKDSELGTAGSDPVLNFSVATDHYDSKAKDRVTEWVDVAIFGKRAATLAPMLKKGTSVAVAGEIYNRRYEHNGEKRAQLTIKASDVKLLGGKPKDGAGTVEAAPAGKPDGEVPF